MASSTQSLLDIIRNLARSHNPTNDKSFTSSVAATGAKTVQIQLPGPDSTDKVALEKELTALASRINYLESKASRSQTTLPITPSEPDASPFAASETVSRPRLPSRSGTASLVDQILTENNGASGGTTPSRQLSETDLSLLRDHIQEQARQIQSQREYMDSINDKLEQQQRATTQALGGIESSVNEVETLKRELSKNQQVNITYIKVLREIGSIVTAVANGDLSMRLSEKEFEADPEIITLKRTVNRMVEQLQDFASQVTHLAREVGTEGRLGGQASLPGVEGIWLDLTSNVNSMARRLTDQVREIAVVTTAVASGDLSRKVTVECKGEIADLKLTINTMVDQLRTFATEVTRVSRDVGTEGVLGGQIQIEGVQGKWADLVGSVNDLANNLTTQVRDISLVTTAVARGDLSRMVNVECKGEVSDLKLTINGMVEQLRTFATEVTRVSQDVGTEGVLGGQIQIDGVEGKWADLVTSVNKLAQNLTEQVRDISQVTTAVARGNLTQKVKVECKGEVAELKLTINAMVDRLDTFAYEVSRVAREVGTDGVLGGQAKVEDVQGKWADLLKNVNTMATSLSSQVRAFGDITNAATQGNYTQMITVEASGEMNELKQRINTMVSDLRESIQKNTAAREAAELANKTKSEFLANMWVDTQARGDAELMKDNRSHEIRTPMNGIIGMTQLTLDTELNQSQREMMSLVYQLANSLLTIIDDILDISKIEANRMVVEEIPFTLRGQVFNGIKSLAVKANEKSLDLAYEVDSSVPDYVIGDSFRLRQIILNLVGNAIKFTDKGEVRLRISAADQANCGPGEVAVKFCVSDTGIGIASDKLDLIFDTFQQADGSTTRRFGGTGLGLSISKRLVGLMHGRMWVESDYGSGSQFFFTVRFKIGNPDISAIEKALGPYKKHTVLFVDKGNTGHSAQIVAALKELDLVPMVVHDEAEVPAPTRKAGKANYDCILVDCPQAGKALRNVEDFKYIPIVMLAPKISISFRSALEDGIASYMTTPCLPIDLGNALVPALHGRAAPTAADASMKFDILLAEDNAVNQRLAVKILQKHGHTVAVANNGLEAYEAIQKKRYDVVLMDVQMPIMGGFEATQRIRVWESEQELSRTPIIALTAHAMLGDREKCIQAQMDEYLSKPLKPTQLIQTILKCATLGGALLDRNKDQRALPAAETVESVGTAGTSAAGSPLKPTASAPLVGSKLGGINSNLGPAPRRPDLAMRYTDLPLESPALIAEDLDPLFGPSALNRANSS